MCGIVGFYDKLGVDSNSSRDIALNMASTIRHRGPDDCGVWLGEQNRLALSHQRLSILDISDTGHQPMVSSSGRYILVFNGEIYNYKNIKESLVNINWRGESDTEVLLEAISQWGLLKTLNKCTGMFAFALWDKELKQLSLARDRLGEKPLYYGWNNKVFFFGSELKALKAHPSFQKNINLDAVSLYFNHGYIPSPFSIYTGISKLSPGCIVNLNLKASELYPLKEKPYWSLESITGEPISKETNKIKKNEFIDELDEKLTTAVMRQSISDVPLGSLLSGGIDSSLITAILQKNSQQRIKTFSLGFNEEKYNEAHYAKIIADHIGSDHHEIIVSPNDLQNIIPNLAKIYDEPFGDPSAIPTFIISEFSRNYVTVALTGDGGDELFGGYNHYHRSAQIWSSIRKIPLNIRLVSSSILNPVGVALYNQSLGRKVERLSNYLACETLFECYKVQVEASEQELRNVLTVNKKISGISSFNKIDGYESMMYADSATYLPDDILVKVDRAAMAVGLETRAPLLDHSIVEFAFKIPLEYKVYGGTGKLILKDLLERYIPKSMFDRPKMGFGLPIDIWLRGSLRDWAESNLDEKSLNEIGFLNTKVIRKRWKEHLRGVKDWHYFLWDLLMFVEWYKSDKIEINS
jgi:asparagine synthase (glutamine-hydrolysing)